MSRVRLLRQSTGLDCGPICLQMVAEYYGRPAGIEELTELCRITERGTSFARMAGAAESLGFRTLVIRLPVEKLSRVTLPCIAYWKKFHFVVVEEVTRGRVCVADPKIGRKDYPLADFVAGWADVGATGPVLLLEEPGPDGLARRRRSAQPQ